MREFVKDLIKLIDSHYSYLGEDKEEIFTDLLAIMVGNQIPITPDLLDISDAFDDALEESKYYVEKGLDEDDEFYDEEEEGGC